jgi:hypothetical protein
MPQIENPALKALVARIGRELVLAQVLIQRVGAGFSLCHVQDRGLNPVSLTTFAPEDARAVSLNTASGEFRPLKCAPTLRHGWRITAKTNAELATALDRLYPGAIADWHAAQTENPPVTHYREYAERQTGMFRIAAKLNDAQAAEVIRATCTESLCLKRRLWTVPGLAPDAAEAKSLVPCLEPCAVLMENARKAARALSQPDAEKP